MSVDGVVPFAVEVVGVEGYGGELFVGDFDAGGIPARVVGGLDAEASGGARGRDQFDDGAHGGEGPAPPVHGDEAEHAVLDPVPLRRAGRIVAHRDAQTGLGRQAGQFYLPGPDPISVGASGIGGDQQPCRVGEASSAHLIPPGSDGVDRELGGVRDVADVDPSLVVGQVVDPIRDGLGELAQSPISEVVHAYSLRFAHGRPLGAAVSELADQLLFLGVHADRRLVVVDEPLLQVVALSSTEAEYYDLGNTAREAAWLRQLFLELGIDDDDTQTVRVYGDNQSSLSLTDNPVIHQRSKHVDIQHH